MHDGALIAKLAVAVACGFADQAHLTRSFRRSFGYTPGDLLAAATRGQADSWQ